MIASLAAAVGGALVGDAGSAPSATSAAHATCAKWDITGVWRASQAGYPSTSTYTFKQSANGQVTGSGNFPPFTGTLTGTMKGNKLEFIVRWNNGVSGHVFGTVTAGTISGDGYDDQVPRNTATWSATGKARCLSEDEGSISGRVVETECDDNKCTSKGLPGVAVAAAGKGGGSATTKSDGRYSIDKLEPGSYRVTPSLAGREFEPPSSQVTVTKGGTASASFETCAVRKTQSVRAPAPTPACNKGPDGLDWTVPDRVQNQVKHWNAAPILDRSSVYPSYWPVSLFLTTKGEKFDGCGKNDAWQWKVTAPKGATIKKQPEEGCAPTMKVSDLGTYKVEATGKVDGKKKTFRRDVVVKDWLIVGMGDSNGSGEGNAPFEVERCNRGSKSYQYLTAKYVEEQDPHTSVTFLFASCSGAIASNLDAKPYPGIRKASPFLDPQIDQALWLLTRGEREPKDPRPVDAAIISAGVNDIAFGPVMETCTIGGLLDPAIIEQLTPKLAGKTCVDWPVEFVDDGKGWITKFNGPLAPGSVSTTIKVKNGVYRTKLAASAVYKRWEKGKGLTLSEQVFGLIDRLPAKYAGLAQRLALPIRLNGGGLGMADPSHVFITQYPNFTRGASGQLCDDTASGAFPNWVKPVWGFIDEAGGRLNDAAVKGANLHQWTPVAIPARAWRGHGYCAGSETWFTSIWTAVSLASTIFNPEFNNKEGAFHPNELGHEMSFRYTRPIVCAKLYKTADCTGDPRK